MLRLSALVGFVFLAQALPQSCVPTLDQAADLAAKTETQSELQNDSPRLPPTGQETEGELEGEGQATQPGDELRGFGSIAGIVATETDNGRVPLENALVQLLREGHIVREAHTNAEGRYRIGDVPAGHYGLVARARGYLPSDARVEVAAGKVTEQNFVLRPVGDLGGVFGHVAGLEPSGERHPLPGALVVLRQGDHVIRETHADREGRYVIRGVEPGEYGIAARAPFFLPESARIVVVAGERTEQNFLLQRGIGGVAGRVFGENDAGEAVPLEGALVQLRRGDRVIREGRTDAEGRYAFREVPAGHYGISAQAEGYAPGLARIAVHPNHVTEQNFRLHPPEDFGAVRGRVAGESDSGEPVPLAGAVVRLVREGVVLREVRTDEHGNYGIRMIRPGEYGLVASAEGYEPGRANIAIHAGQITEQNFLLHRHTHETGRIEGVVEGETAEGNVPLAGALVRLFRMGTLVRETRTNDHGQYAMEEVRAGEFAMVALAEGYMPQEVRPVLVEAGQTTVQNFLLHPRQQGVGAIVGTVSGITPDGRQVPLAGALVTLLHEGQVVREVRTGELGRYAMHEVREGQYGMVARAEGYMPADARVSVTANHVTEQHFVLHPH